MLIGSPANQVHENLSPLLSPPFIVTGRPLFRVHPTSGDPPAVVLGLAWILRQTNIPLLLNGLKCFLKFANPALVSAHILNQLVLSDWQLLTPIWFKWLGHKTRFVIRFNIRASFCFGSQLHMVLILLEDLYREEAVELIRSDEKQPRFWK